MLFAFQTLDLACFGEGTVQFVFQEKMKFCSGQSQYSCQSFYSVTEKSKGITILTFYVCLFFFPLTFFPPSVYVARILEVFTKLNHHSMYYTPFVLSPYHAHICHHNLYCVFSMIII